MKAKYIPLDYQARLHGGVILWDNVPHIIQVDGSDLHILDLTSQDYVARRINPHDDRLDIGSIELGYINTEQGAYYLSRMPARQFQQSITRKSIVEYFLSIRGIEATGRGRSEWLYTKAFRESYTKKYPSFNRAVELIQTEGRSSVALSRDVAITVDDLGTVKVFHKLEPVGVITSGSNVVRVPNSEKGWIVSMYLDGFGWEID